VKDTLHGSGAGLAAEYRIVAHALHHLESVTLLATVLVDRHCFMKYSYLRLALSRQECQGRSAQEAEARGAALACERALADGGTVAVPP
jgi:hypothetical protein